MCVEYVLTRRTDEVRQVQVQFFDSHFNVVGLNAKVVAAFGDFT